MSQEHNFVTHLQVWSPKVHQVTQCERTPHTAVCVSEGHRFSVSPSHRTTSEKVRCFTRLSMVAA